MAELWVGAGKQYASVSTAYAAAASGDTIFVMAGTYTNESLTISRDVNIVGVGGMAHFKTTTSIPNGKAIFITNADVTFENIEFSGATVRDGNGAGIRYESGNLTVNGSYFHDNQNGILAASNLTGTITIHDSEFARNGRGDGQTHGIYVNSIAKLTITDSHFHDTNVGHHVKSRAIETEIRDSLLDDGTASSSYSIDLPNGGAATIVGNTLIQNASAQNKYMVHYGGEVATPRPGAVLIENNTFIDYLSGISVGVRNQTLKTIELRENTFIGLDRDGDGPFARVDNVVGVLGSSGADIVGTAGLDKIDYRYSPGAVNVDLATGVASDGYGSTDTLNGVEQVRGSRFADVLTGDAKDNRLEGGDGDDRLSGGAGDDMLEGGAGDDVISGGAGIDTAIYGGKASDFRVSLSGDEVVVEALNGQPEGVDRLTGVEKLQFSDGVVNAPTTTVNAAPTVSNDEASTTGATPVTIDVLRNDSDPNGDPLAIASIGAAQHGVAVALNGKVVYTPAAGYVGADAFTYRASDGKGGFSTATVSVTVAAVPSIPPVLPEPPATYDGKVFVGTNGAQNTYGTGKADFLDGNGGNDSFWGYAGNDRLDGGDGDDRIYAGDGDDVLIGGAGDDLLDGGNGIDVAVYSRNAADYKVTSGVSGITVEALAGTEGADRLYGVEQIRFADKTIDAATLVALEQDEASEPPAPDDTAPVAEYDGKVSVGTNASQNMYGTGKADFLQGNGGNDSIWGYDGNDRLDGGDGADRLNAGGGGDILIGGAGNDLLSGGAGEDLFVFQPGCGADVVTDFLAFGEADRIDLSAFEIDGFATLKAMCVDDGTDVRIDLAGADSVTLLGNRLAELSADHFLL
jgi:Ca2+-binding RTX toxin-like protein